MSSIRPGVVIVGRPNVGKSTLFNRLARARLAMVDDQPGVTRDWRQAPADWRGQQFRVIDTAGFDDPRDSETEAKIQAQTDAALAQADLVLFVVDARAGITPLDHQFAEKLRRRNCPIILVANKAEGRAGEPGLLESYDLGLGDPIGISAEHGDGITDLLEAVAIRLEENGPNVAEPTSSPSEEDESTTLRLAIIGRPNTGKSTLVNQLLGENRVVAGPEPGLTRDAISISWQYNDRAIELVDTAGLRRKSKVTERVEKLSIDHTLRTIRFAHIAVLMLDATEGPRKQDLVIANRVIDEGRGLVVAVNKWDLVADKQKLYDRLTHDLSRGLSQIRGVPIIRLSAREGRGIDYLMDAVFTLYERWNTRLPTAKMNQWLAAVTAQHPPPMSSGRQVKIRYMTQTGIRPPTFALFVNRPDALPESYRRYLVNEIRSVFGVQGTPIRLMARGGRNPYVKK